MERAANITLPRCQSGRRSLECRQSSRICACPPRPIQVLCEWISVSPMRRCVSSKLILVAVCVPTVTGLILTPSSTWAEFASSDSLCVRTALLQSVLTKVVRPICVERQVSVADCIFKSYHGPAPCAVGAGRQLDAITRRLRHTSTRGTTDHEAELNALLDILLAADHLLI